MDAPNCFWWGGAIGYAVDTFDALLITDQFGNRLISDALPEIKKIYDVQPDPTKPPVEMADLTVTYLKPSGERASHTVTRRADALSKDFEGELRAALPDHLRDVEIDNKQNRLFAAVLARSIKGQDHRVPTMTTHEWKSEKGWFRDGRLLSDVPAEIVRTYKHETTHEPMFRVRIARKEGEGYIYADLTWDQMEDGTGLSTFGRVENPVLLSMAMRGRYDSLSDAERDRLATEDFNQQRAQAEERLRRKLRMPRGR